MQLAVVLMHTYIDAHYKNRRTRQESIRVQQEEEVMEKVAARGFAKSYLTDLHHAVLESLVQSGHFFDPVEKEVESVFLPWLRESASNFLENIRTARTITESMYARTCLFNINYNEDT